MAEPSEFIFPIAVETCSVTSVFTLAYPFAILDHYRIEIGVWRGKPGETAQFTHKGEPIEKGIVIIVYLIAVLTFGIVVLAWK